MVGTYFIRLITVWWTNAHIALIAEQLAWYTHIGPEKVFLAHILSAFTNILYPISRAVTDVAIYFIIHEWLTCKPIRSWRLVNASAMVGSTCQIRLYSTGWAYAEIAILLSNCTDIASHARFRNNIRQSSQFVGLLDNSLRFTVVIRAPFRINFTFFRTEASITVELHESARLASFVKIDERVFTFDVGTVTFLSTQRTFPIDGTECAQLMVNNAVLWADAITSLIHINCGGETRVVNSKLLSKNAVVEKLLIIDAIP